MRHYSVNYLYHVAVRHLHMAFELRPSSYPYISGDSIRTVAQHYFEGDRSLDPAKVCDLDIIFVEAKNIKRFFTDIEPNIKAYFILVTHNSDTNITDEYRPYIQSKFLIHWFAQNCLIKDSKMSPLPIGLENKWFHLHGLPKYYEEIKLESVTKKTQMLYKFSTITNPTERGLALETLKKHPLAITYDDWREPLPYLRTLSQYKFVVSPPGNGVDCIRTWEAMYLGTIPIVKKSVLTEYFYDCGLPLLLIEDWEEVLQLTKETLDKKYDIIKPRFTCEALWVEYWINKILDKTQ